MLPTLHACTCIQFLHSGTVVLCVCAALEVTATVIGKRSVSVTFGDVAATVLFESFGVDICEQGGQPVSVLLFEPFGVDICHSGRGEPVARAVY